MTINEYTQHVLRTASTTEPGMHTLLNGVMGLSGESGECIDLMKKVMFQGHAVEEKQMAEELGDVAFYLALSAHAIGYDLETVLQMNVDKLKERYPDGFDPDRSRNRKEYE